MRHLTLFPKDGKREKKPTYCLLAAQQTKFWRSYPSHLYPYLFSPIFSHNDRHTGGWDLTDTQKHIYYIDNDIN